MTRSCLRWPFECTHGIPENALKAVSICSNTFSLRTNNFHAATEARNVIIGSDGDSRKIPVFWFCCILTSRSLKQNPLKQNPLKQNPLKQNSILITIFDLQCGTPCIPCIIKLGASGPSTVHVSKTHFGQGVSRTKTPTINLRRRSLYVFAHLL